MTKPKRKAAEMDFDSEPTYQTRSEARARSDGTSWMRGV